MWNNLPRMDRYSETERSRLRRVPARGSHDRAAVEAVLDAGLIAHVGFAVDAQPFVLPMIYARQADTLVLHGAQASRVMKKLREGIPACVTVTHLDGLVLARSAFHHSVNYRSVVAFGTAREVAPDEKRAALEAIVERIAKGRAAAVRSPSPKELDATAVLSFGIEEASVKQRTGGPLDDDADLVWPVWAGHVPLYAAAGTPIAADGVDGRYSPPQVRT